jgi:hypothetical protein
MILKLKLWWNRLFGKERRFEVQSNDLDLVLLHSFILCRDGEWILHDVNWHRLVGTDGELETQANLEFARSSKEWEEVYEDRIIFSTIRCMGFKEVLPK